MNKVALGIFAHPDDAEFLCTGTLSLIQKAGWEIHISTLAPGDKGTDEYSKPEISKIRKLESQNAASLIKASYHCLDFEDIYILYDRISLNKTVELIRTIKPSIVFTSSPEDYMIDHEITSLIVQTACFSAGIKNLDVSISPFHPVPFLYYCDPMEGKDKFGDPIKPSIYVNITSEIGLKENMLASHSSQRAWLMKHHKMDKYIHSMKELGEKRGGEINVPYAEGFRQHLGHGYPQENVLESIIPEYLHGK